MSDARKLADEKLRGAVGAVVAARNPRRRAEVTATLLREVQGEQARIRHEGRLWALQTVEQHWSRVVDAVKDGTDAALRTVLEDVAANAAEVSDDLLTNFNPTPHDIAEIRAAIGRRVGALWGLSYQALRTGAFDQTATQRPSTMTVERTIFSLRVPPEG